MSSTEGITKTGENLAEVQRVLDYKLTFITVYCCYRNYMNLISSDASLNSIKIWQLDYKQDHLILF